MSECDIILVVIKEKALSKSRFNCLLAVRVKVCLKCK